MKNKNNERLKKNCVRKWRIYRGFTIQQMSDKTKIGVQTIRRLELNRNKVCKLSHFRKIAKILNVEIKQLWEVNENE
jgi:transcriptional regulator with XRE-family HTH domain